MLLTALILCHLYAYQIPEAPPVIVLCAFGTSTSAMSTYDHIGEAVQTAFPEHEIRWAYTSTQIIEKLKKRGILRQTLPEVYEQLRRAGKTRVLVQSLHVAPGQEFHHKVLRAPTHGLNVKYGLPLLSGDRDIEKVFRALEPRFTPEADAVTILCAHGNDRYPEFNALLTRLDRYVRKQRKHTFVATVEGEPGTVRPFADARAAGKNEVHFVPLMLVAGDHIMNDVMGEAEDSWRSQLAPMTASVGKALGEDEAILEIYIHHIQQVLEQF